MTTRALLPISAIRGRLVTQLGDLAAVAAPDKVLSVEEVNYAIKTTKDGAPGPDSVGINTIKSLMDCDIADLICAFNDSWRSGLIPEAWTDSYIGPVPKPCKDHRYLKGHRIITCQNVIGKIPEKLLHAV